MAKFERIEELIADGTVGSKGEILGVVFEFRGTKEGKHHIVTIVVSLDEVGDEGCKFRGNSILPADCVGMTVGVGIVIGATDIEVVQPAARRHPGEPFDCEGVPVGSHLHAVEIVAPNQPGAPCNELSSGTNIEIEFAHRPFIGLLPVTQVELIPVAIADRIQPTVVGVVTVVVLTVEEP